MFFEREFQPMTSAPDDSSISSNQDTNQFLVQAEIDQPHNQGSYLTYKYLFNYNSFLVPTC